MATRAKFKLNSYTVDEHHETGEEKRTLNMTPVYDADPESENGQFFAYTPSGSIQLGVTNKAVWGEFEIGDEIYVDFTKVPK